MRVLVVDDADDALQALQTGLQMLGHNVRIAMDGIEALEVLEQFDAEVAIVDISMPRLDGYGVAKAIRADAALCRMHLIAYSGLGSPRDKVLAFESGFDQHITKPLSLLQLEAALGQCRPRVEKRQLV